CVSLCEFSVLLVSHSSFCGCSVYVPLVSAFFFFNDPATTEIYTLSLHDALPIYRKGGGIGWRKKIRPSRCSTSSSRSTASRCCRSEEHTSELQSPYDLVCRLLLEKKKKKTNN